MKKTGRPKLEPDKLRKLTIGVRVNQAEMELLQNKAKAMCMSPAKWLRIAALSRQLPDLPVPRANLIAYKKLLKLAVNINQLTRASHQGKTNISPDIFINLESELRKLQRMLLGIEYDCQND